MKHRTEQDSMGPIKIPENLLYGASTQRAAENFQISLRFFDRNFITALGLIKYAAAKANKKLKLLNSKHADIITQKSLDVANGKYDNHFVLDIFQTGSGTSTNMNANEIIANLCNKKLTGKIGTKKPIHPNDHVNLGQSSNDVIPSAIHVACALLVKNELLPHLNLLYRSLRKKNDEGPKNKNPGPEFCDFLVLDNFKFLII